MKKERSITLNFIMNALLTISSFIFPLITFPYVSRILLPEGTGKVSFATSVVTYFSMFAQLGIPTYGIRACAKVRDDKEALSRTVHELLAINLFMSVLAYFIFGVCLVRIPRFRAEKTLFIIISLTILFNAIGVEWLYKGLEQYTYITVRSLIFKAIAVLAMLGLVHKKSDYVIYGALTIFAASASNILNLFNAHKYIKVQPVGHYNFRQHFKPILVFFAMSCATAIYTNLDTVMLGFMKSDVDVGYYNAAVKIKSVLLGVVTSLGAVLLPRASYYIEHGLKDRFQVISKKAIEFVFLIAVPLTVYFILFARESVLFLSGAAYEGAVVPMQIIMPTLFWIGLTNIMGIQMLVPLGREKVVLYSEIAGALVDLVINMALIPRMASAGAAIGTLVAEIIVWIVQYIALRVEVEEAYRTVQYKIIAIAVILGTVTSMWVKYMNWNEFGTLVLTGILFLGTYFVVLLLLKEPLVWEIKNQMIKKLVKK